MAVSVNVNSKVCATCRWWEGPRELGTYKRDNKGNVIPISINAEGQKQHKCLAGTNPTKGSFALSRCNKWSKWEKL